MPLLRHPTSLRAGGLVFAWVGAVGKFFDTEEEARRARAQYLHGPEVDASALESDYQDRLTEFDAARHRGEATERHVAHLLVAAWSWLTRDPAGVRGRRPAFVVNDTARADVMLCLSNEVGKEAWLQVRPSPLAPPSPPPPPAAALTPLPFRCS